MKYSVYALQASTTFTEYTFESEGKRGKVTKLVQYSPTQIDRVYNLGFGDKNSVTNDFDDQVITDNGDMEKVLATVARTIYFFTDHHADCLIYLEGSTPARTRLYRMAIFVNYKEIEQDFEVFGLLNKGWEMFKYNQPYEAFLIKRRITAL